MKKALSMILVLTMVLALALPAMAAETVSPTGNTTQDVTATYSKPVDTEGARQYFITISWAADENNSLRYEGEKATYTWNGTQYEKKVTNEKTKGWSGTAKWTVTVENKSNAGIKFSTSTTNTYELTVTNGSEQTLGSAAVDQSGKPIGFTETDKNGTAQTGHIDVTYTAVASAKAPAVSEATSITVGQITVTVEAN